MTPRKAIYTPEESKARASQQRQEWTKENLTSINIRLTPGDKAILEQYAQYKGLPVARLMRVCAETCMRLDGWTYQPEEGQAAQEEE